MNLCFRIMLLAVSGLLLLGAGCRSLEEAPGQSAFDEAVRRIREGRASCLLVSGGRILEQRSGRGLSPLLELYDSSRTEFSGGMIADKVIGRAAAFILIRGGVVRVYGKLMSRDAREMLLGAGIRVEYDLLVPRILNRSRDGLCPLEQSVLEISDPEEAMTAIRRRLQELRKNN